MTSTVQLSLIIPTYNERDNVPLLVWMLNKSLQSVVQDHEWEIVFVDDSSPDGTSDVIKQLQQMSKRGSEIACNIHLVQRPGKLGLGTAYSSGLAKASGDLIVLMDADLSHHPRHIPEMLQRQSSSGCDIVTGSRYIPKGGVSGWSLGRRLTSRGANLLASVALGATVSDLTGAFRLYRRQCLQQLLSVTHSRGYAFQMEVIVRAQYAGMAIQEVPIVFVDRLFGASKLGPSEFVLFLTGLARLMLQL